MPDFAIFDKTRPIIVAVSGGPDSMALAHMLYQEGFRLVLAHVNYHKRESAIRDQKIVETFARERNLPFEIKDYPKTKKEEMEKEKGRELEEKGNFQAKAREFRYGFFFDLAKKYDSDQIALAHHLDDALETYLMQKGRKSIPERYGLAKVRNEKGIKLVRPLLKLSKADLVDYCKDNSIIYGTDESNLEDHYLRNRIRHHILAPLSHKEKGWLIEQMEKDNLSLETKRKEAELLLSGPVENWIKKKEAWFILTVLLLKLSGKAISKRQALQELKKLEKGWLRLAEGVLLIYQSRLYFLSETVFDSKQIERKEDLLSLSENAWNIESEKSGEKIENLFVKKDEFPLRLRPAQIGDEIEMRYGSKKLSRFFIDRKIPAPLREFWPVVENRWGKIIYVFGLGAEKAHFDLDQGVYLKSPWKKLDEILKKYAIMI